MIWMCLRLFTVALLLPIGTNSAAVRRRVLRGRDVGANGKIGTCGSELRLRNKTDARTDFGSLIRRLGQVIRHEQRHWGDDDGLYLFEIDLVCRHSFCRWRCRWLVCLPAGQELT